jgi:DNA-binding response OmpR family regulator
MKILLADDDADMVDVTAYALRREGFNIIVATDGAQALRRWESDQPDLVLLDVGMPRINGLEVCRKIRQESDTPVIMLTAAGDEEHVVQGFKHGADDYITKPFSPKQLAMRIRAVMRRSSGKSMAEPQSILKVGKYTLDMESHQVNRGDVVAQLTPLEFRILYMLAMNEGRVVSFGRLVEYAWGYNGGEPSMLKTHISHIRKKLDLKEGEPGYISVVHGVGYVLQRSSSEGPG